MSEKKIVEISVMGGHVDIDHIPNGIEVRIKDYDTDGAPDEDLFRDEWGQYILTVWPGELGHG